MIVMVHLLPNGMIHHDRDPNMLEMSAIVSTEATAIAFSVQQGLMPEVALVGSSCWHVGCTGKISSSSITKANQNNKTYAI
jgi:hypothetical protein